MLRYISEAEVAPLDALLPEPMTLDALVAISAERVEFLLGPGRTLTLARHAPFLETAWNPARRADLLAESQGWWDLGTALLADQLARPDPSFDAAAAIHAGLTGLLG